MVYIINSRYINNRGLLQNNMRNILYILLFTVSCIVGMERLDDHMQEAMNFNKNPYYQDLMSSIYWTPDVSLFLKTIEKVDDVRTIPSLGNHVTLLGELVGAYCEPSTSDQLRADYLIMLAAILKRKANPNTFLDTLYTYHARIWFNNKFVLSGLASTIGNIMQETKCDQRYELVLLLLQHGLDKNELLTSPVKDRFDYTKVLATLITKKTVDDELKTWYLLFPDEVTQLEFLELEKKIKRLYGSLHNCFLHAQTGYTTLILKKNEKTALKKRALDYSNVEEQQESKRCKEESLDQNES